MSDLLKISSDASRVAEVLKQGKIDPSTVYLVGGCVRDALLGLTSHDLDLVLEKDALRVARMVANALEGSYYTMDEEFQVGRVVLRNAQGDRQWMDFSAMQGDTLEEDLRNRDFTVNAIAVSLADLNTLVDPLRGAEDLFSRRLRVCSSDSFMRDPVRVLRAVRMAAAYQLAFEPETRALLPPAVSALDRVSMERQRDEFLKILDAPQPGTSLRILDHFGILAKLVPEITRLKGETQPPPHIYGIWEHTLHTVEQMDRILRLLDRDYVHDNEEGGDLVSGLISQRLGRYREQITRYVAEELVPDRSFRPMMMMAAFFHDMTKPDHRCVNEDGKIKFPGHEASGAQVFADRGTELRLSRAEIRRVKWMIEGHGQPWQMAKQPSLPSRREVFKFWDAYGDSGVGICLLSLADMLAVYGHTITPQILMKHVDVARTLLEAYWEHPSQVAPDALLDGKEIMEILSLSPGPQVGALITALREAQAVGDVADKQQAIAFLEKQFSEL